MRFRKRLASTLLLGALLAIACGLAWWKQGSLQASAQAAANQPEWPETIVTVHPQRSEFRPTMTAIGTVVALRSISLRNELPGTVQRVALTPGTVVKAGTVLVALDTAVEEAELAELRAQAQLAETMAQRQAQLHTRGATSRELLDRAEAELAVTRARIARTQAVIARKTLRAPFDARVGIADVHEGQFLDQGTLLTTLQGIDAAIYVDFPVPQQVAEKLRSGEVIEIAADAPLQARIVALDARIDASTRNAMVRVRVDDAAGVLLPGASARVIVPTGSPRAALALPSSVLRRDAQGDHLFVVIDGDDGQPRAAMRRVKTQAVQGDKVLIELADASASASTLGEHDTVAASGSFKLRDGALVAIAAPTGSASASAAAR